MAAFRHGANESGSGPTPVKCENNAWVGGSVAKLLLRQAEERCRKPARASGINDKFSCEFHWLPTLTPPQVHSGPPRSGRAGEFDFIPIRHSQRLRLLHQIMIKIRTIPMRVGNCFPRAGADHQLPLAMRVGLETAAEFVMVEGEASFEAAREMRSLFLPGPPFAERPNERQIIIVGDFFEQQIRQGRCGFPDHKTRMTTALKQRGGEAKSMGNHGHERAGESGANDDDLEMPWAHVPASSDNQRPA